MHNRRNIFLLAVLFVFTGAMHFVIPGRYMEIVPPWIPSPLAMVYVSGIAEMLGGLGLLIARLRRVAAVGLIILLVAVFPANVQMLANAIRDGSSQTYIALLWFRLPLQPLLIVWVYRSCLRSVAAELSPPASR